jgi:hypothetical protein
MFRFISLSMIGLATAGLILVAPSAGQAQVPVGVNVRVGPVGVSAGVVPAYPVVAPYPVYVAPLPVVQPPCPVVATYPVVPSVVVRSPVWIPHRHLHHWHRH